MYNGQFLQMMYQQWRNGNEAYTDAWREFVEMAARENNTTTELMLEELKKYRWFNWGE
jgi:hypothetical protein